MKRNFRYITKFEEQTRSAMQTREETNWELNTAIDKAKEIVLQAGKLTKILNTDSKSYASLVDAMSHIKVSIARKTSEATPAQRGENITVWVRELANTISEFYFDDDLKTYPNTPTEITSVVARLKQLIREDCSEFYTMASKIKDDFRSSSARLETRASKEREFTATSSEERGRWEIDVELNGKTVFRYDSDSHNPDEEGYEPTEDGWMKNLTDYQGLADWMSHLGIMDKGETLVVESGREKGRYYARSSSARLETRDWAKAGEMDEVGARELYLFADNESALQNQQKSIITNLARKFAKGAYNKELAIKLWTYLADSASKLYSNANGGQFTPATRRETARMMEELHYPSVQDEAIDYKKRSSSARLEKRGYGLKATDVIGYAWEGELLTVEFVKHLFKTKQVEFDADSLKGRKDMNGIPEGLTANGEEYMPIFGSTELDESDRKMLEEGRSSSARLEKRGFFGGDEDEEEEKQPMSPDDAREEVRLIIMNTHGIYSAWMAMADDATKQWLRTHDDEDEAPTFRDVVDDFTEIVRLGINEMNKSIDEDSEDSEFPENNFSMPDIKWIFEHSGAQDDLDEKWDWRKK